MAYDVAALRSRFPALAEGAAHFDGPGGSQVPDSVGAAVANALTSAVANRGQLTRAERRADQVVASARSAVADLLATPADGVIFGRSMTALTYEMARALSKRWKPGDEIVVTRLDHDANIRPWVQAAESVGATVRWADFDPESSELPVGAVTELIGQQTRLVALTAASNLLGTRPDVSEICRAVRRAGALSYVDGVHLSAHAPIDVRGLGADFFACSPYKWLGPHCGVLVGEPALLETIHPDKLKPSTELVPERFELGTLPYELLAGVTAAVEFIAELGAITGRASSTGSDTRRDRIVASMRAVEDHEQSMLLQLEDRLKAMDIVVNHSRAVQRTPTLLLTFGGRSPAVVAEGLAQLGVNAPAGSFYAIEAALHLGLGEAGGLRVGIAPYTDQSDLDRLVDGLEVVLKQS